MPQTKQIRVSELVHEELQNKKRDDESFDDVLRGLLDLEPETEDLLSYYSDELQEIIQKLLTEIADVGNLSRSIENNGATEVIAFRSIENRRTIATIELKQQPSRSIVTVKYRNQQGNLEKIGSARQDTGEEIEGGILGETGMFDDPEELVTVSRRRAEDAYSAWG